MVVILIRVVLLQAAEEGTSMWRLNKVLYTHNNVALGVRDMTLGKHVLFTTYVGLLSVLHSHFLQVNKDGNYHCYIGLSCMLTLLSTFVSFSNKL